MKHNVTVREILRITDSRTFDDFLQIREFCRDAPIDHTLELSYGSWRFIRESDIMKVLIDELENDTYLLGCFNPGVLQEVTDVPANVFRVLQKAEAFDGIGELLIALDKVKGLAREYARLDGYGHHFGVYDGDQYEINVDGIDYLMFRLG